MDCRYYVRNEFKGPYQSYKSKFASRKVRDTNRYININDKSMTSFLKYNTKCYIFHNLGHIASDYRRNLKWLPKQVKEELFLPCIKGISQKFG